MEYEENVSKEIAAQYGLEPDEADLVYFFAVSEYDNLVHNGAGDKEYKLLHGDFVSATTTGDTMFSSWIADKILNFNSDLYYQSREYLAECYKNGHIVAA